MKCGRSTSVVITTVGVYCSCEILEIGIPANSNLVQKWKMKASHYPLSHSTSRDPSCIKNKILMHALIR